MTHNKIIIYLYRFSFFMLVITGFGQMPVFKRYYVADIPGLGWLAQFYTTHILHYIFAIIFLFIIFYFVIMHFGNRRKTDIVLMIKSGIFTGLIISGFILVLRNYPGYMFSDVLISITDLIHLGLVMIFFLFSLVIYVKNFRNG